MGREEKMPMYKRFQPHPPEELHLKAHKRRRVDSSSVYGSLSDFTCWREGLAQKKQQTSSGAVDYLHPSSISNLLEELDSGEYGSVTNDIGHLLSLKIQSLIHHHAMNPARVKDYLGLESCTSEDLPQSKQLTTSGVIDVEDDYDSTLKVRSLAGPLIILDSDDEEENVSNWSSNQQREVISNQLHGNLVMMNFEIQPSTQSDVNQTGGHLQAEKAAATDDDDDEEEEEDNEMPNADDDGLKEFWDAIDDEIKEEKKNAVEPSSAVPAAECDHSFILRDDIGYVCRVCGVIRQSIETIIEYQFTKARNTRTYPYEGRARRDPDDADYIPGEYDAPAHDFEVADISAHPRHRKQMKPHQIEGFNFLLRNLVTENPGGCIMAHAPGSGKTFMVISFLQSFMTKLPSARPLVILPRGILAIWKKEFLRWQVEDIPLFDFYSVKADSRAQQLEVLKKWEGERSILFLGYKQFSSIVCDTGSAAYQCHRILLKVPSIVILDEGHTPRNQDTDILTSLEKIETPRKVVLSGTLYQNHVKEVFNILNLVRPKFLRLDSSKEIKRRILSKVSMYNRRDILKKGSDNEFYEVVEHTLVKDTDFKRKVMVIQDLRQMTGEVLHYYKGDFLDELPGLVDFTVLLRLSPRQQHGVSELRKLNRKFKITSEGSALYVHPQLRSLSKNAVAKDRVDVGKIDAILENLDRSEGVKAKFFLNLLHLCESHGEKLLVFSQYLLPLKFLERLSMKVRGYQSGKEMFMITGDHDNDEREISMERFNSSPDARVFFGSIRACGEGISLVGASRILILDIHLNPSVTRQAIGRAFRPGQVRKVFVYRLVAGASPEEEDHLTCFKKECIAKMWFEWNELNGYHDFAMETVNVNDCGDEFLETPGLREDVMCVYQR